MAKSNTDYRVTLGIESKAYKQALREVNRENKEIKKQARETFKQSKLDAEDGIGGIIAMAKKFAPAISAGAAAFKVSQTAMQENQRFTDEWARVTESAKASYESFVDSLVNADFSGFFTRIDDVIARARDAADALDALDTTKIFNDVALSKLNLDIARYKSILRLGQGSPEDLTAAKQGYEDALKKMQDISLTNASANINAFGAKLAEYVTTKGFVSSTSDFVSQDKEGRYQIKEGSLYNKYYKDLATYLDWDARYKAEKALREKNAAAAREEITSGGVSSLGAGIYNKMRGVSVKGNMSDEAFKELQAFMELSDDKLRELFGYLKQAWADQASVYNAMTQSARYMNAGGSAGGRGGSVGSSAKVYKEGSIGWLEEQIAKYSEDLKAATTQLEMDEANYWIERYKRDLEPLKKASESFSVAKPGAKHVAIGGGIGLQGFDDFRKFKPTTLSLFESKPVKNSEIEANKDLSESTEIATDGLLLVSDTMQRLGLTSQIADEGLRTTLGVLGRFFSFAGSILGGTAGKVFSGLGSLIGSFSGGGIVGGTSYTGDRLTARVNSGEMILNAAQQGQLFNMLNGGGAGGGSWVLRGEDVYSSVRNYGRRTGKIYLP